MKDEFNKLSVDQLNPDERIVAILKFIQKNHKGIFKCLIGEIKYCVKIISTGQLNDVDILNKQITDQIRVGKNSTVNQREDNAKWAEAMTNAERFSIRK